MAVSHGRRVLAHPALVDFLDGHRVEVVQLPPPHLSGGHQPRPFEHPQVFHRPEPRHLKARAQLAERLPIAGEEVVQQRPAARIGQRFEHLIHTAATIGD